ncbi:restriction endonuclease [Halorubrum sp. LN27]|uniref:restriction endonuclease n=1 Tax=Halorubrum sp. LN27 TaxID=2801032 RepID=UPI00190B3C3E|nr:restriction endonuclease [Halorubrum sp. LN27]
MSDPNDDSDTEIPAVGANTEETDQESVPEHDPTNGRWLEKTVAEALENWGYRTARNEYLFGLETDVIARRIPLRNEPDDFIVVECKDWQTTLVGRDGVEAISHRAALARAMPILVVAWGVTSSAWMLAQRLDVRILTLGDLTKRSLPPLTEHRPPTGTLRTRREPRVSELRDGMPDLLRRLSALEIESPVFVGAGRGPCYVPDRTGNDAYVNAYDSDYDFG